MLETYRKNSLSLEEASYYHTYIIIHEKTGSIYVGSTGELKERVNRHYSKLKYNIHSNKKLQELYNQDNLISFCVFEVEDRQAAYDLEQKIIDENLDNPKLLNYGLSVRAPNQGKKLSEITRAKIASKFGPLHHNYGKKFSEEHRAKMSLSSIGKSKSEESIRKMRLTKLGKIASDETRAKMSRHMKGKYVGKDNPMAKKVSIDGVIYDTLQEAASMNNISKNCMWRRLTKKTPGYENWFYV